MLLNDDEIKERIESPLNLLNRLKSSLSKTSNSPHSSQSPCIPPTASELIPDLEEKITNSTAKAKAMSLMVSAIDELKTKIHDVHKPETLSQIAVNMSRVIAAQEQVKFNHATVSSQIIVYAPQVQSLDNFEIIDVAE